MIHIHFHYDPDTMSSEAVIRMIKDAVVEIEEQHELDFSCTPFRNLAWKGIDLYFYVQIQDQPSYDKIYDLLKRLFAGKRLFVRASY